MNVVGARVPCDGHRLPRRRPRRRCCRAALRSSSEELEQRWSRFLPDSEVSQLNRTSGRVCVVSDLTFELVSRAEQARVATSGAFNPLMLDQLEQLGYDRTWDRVERDRRDVVETQAASVEPIELFADACAVRLPEGTRFDPGGIGKGLAGDLVAVGAAERGCAVGADRTRR